MTTPSPAQPAPREQSYVVCTVCHRRKKPIGRNSMDSGLCSHECEGYRQEPLPGPYWPNEEPDQVAPREEPRAPGWFPVEEPEPEREIPPALYVFRECEEDRANAHHECPETRFSFGMGRQEWCNCECHHD